MSSSSEPSKPPSKKDLKKAAAKAEKMRKKAAAGLVVEDPAVVVVNDPLAGNYGDMAPEKVQSSEHADLTVWKKVKDLNPEMVADQNQENLIRGRVKSVHSCGKMMTFVVVRQGSFTVQCVVRETTQTVSRSMVKFAANLSRESVVEVHGIVSVPANPIRGTSQQVELQVTKIFCVSRASPLPISLEDTSRSDKEIEEALKKGEPIVRVNADTRLDNRVLELRTSANQAIFRLQSALVHEFRELLLSKQFTEIHTPKLMEGTSEGGAAVFKVMVNDQEACLAQSAQLHKQMAIAADFERVFEVGSYFRAEKSHTSRHLYEFIGLNVEMEIKRHYVEVMDIVDWLFVSIFNTLNTKCKQDLEAIAMQHPFQPLKYLPETLRLRFEDGIQMLKDAGMEVDPFADLTTEAERRLGELVFTRYNTEFFILHGYPLASRPFFTMPSPADARYSNSFDVFIRGEEIISGAQRVHVEDDLRSRVESLGINVSPAMARYFEAFRYGMPPHGGFGVGLERVVKLFCDLGSVRQTSLFPRFPGRLAP